MQKATGGASPLPVAFCAFDGGPSPETRSRKLHMSLSKPGTAERYFRLDFVRKSNG